MANYTFVFAALYISFFFFLEVISNYHRAVDGCFQKPPFFW